MDQAIISYMRQKFNLLIGEASAEKIKKEIGTAIATSGNTYLMKGRDIRSGTPREITLKEEDTAAALKPTLDVMMAGIKTALENTPPELSADLVDMGLILTGGGALLKNIDKLNFKRNRITCSNSRRPSFLCCCRNRKSVGTRRIIFHNAFGVLIYC